MASPSGLLLDRQLELKTCPHCGIAKPLLSAVALGIGGKSTVYQTSKKDGHTLCWSLYQCSSCGQMVLARSSNTTSVGVIKRHVDGIWPSQVTVEEAVPAKAKILLEQAISSVHAPAGAVMLCASAVDAMLKEINLKDGSLYARINKAVEQHLITPQMASWAHEVRLDANDQRHVDENAVLPSSADALRLIDFVVALAEYLFVLPARIQKGRGGKINS